MKITLYTGQPANSQRFDVVVRHDAGKVRYNLPATSSDAAIKSVLQVEKAPASSVVSCQPVAKKITKD